MGFGQKTMLPSVSITPYAQEAMGASIGPLLATGVDGLGSAVWPGADLALYWPFSLTSPVANFWVFFRNGAVAAGNVDARIYDQFGTALTASIQGAQVGAGAYQTTAVAVTLGPGTFYFGIVCDNAAATMNRLLFNANEMAAAAGMLQEQLGAGAAMPNIATWAHYPLAYCPMSGLSFRPGLL